MAWTGSPQDSPASSPVLWSGATTTTSTTSTSCTCTAPTTTTSPTCTCPPRILLDLCKYHLGEWLLQKPAAVRYFGCWLFNATNALFGVAFWRGVWFLYRLDLGVGVTNLALVQVFGVVVLSVLRIPKSLMASPLGVDMDTHEVTFTNGTYFRQVPDAGWRFLGDVLFTNVVIRQVVVLTWWSCWSLENEFFYFQTPEGETQDVVSYDSLLLGYTLAMVGVLLSPLSSLQVTVCLSQLLLHLTSTKLWVVRPLDLLATLLAFYARSGHVRASCHPYSVVHAIKPFYNRLPCHPSNMPPCHHATMPPSLQCERVARPLVPTESLFPAWLTAGRELPGVPPAGAHRPLPPQGVQHHRQRQHRQGLRG